MSLLLQAGLLVALRPVRGFVRRLVLHLALPAADNLAPADALGNAADVGRTVRRVAWADVRAGAAEVARGAEVVRVVTAGVVLDVEVPVLDAEADAPVALVAAVVVTVLAAVDAPDNVRHAAEVAHKAVMAVRDVVIAVQAVARLALYVRDAMATVLRVVRIHAAVLAQKTVAVAHLPQQGIRVAPTVLVDVQIVALVAAVLVRRRVAVDAAEDVWGAQRDAGVHAPVVQDLVLVVAVTLALPAAPAHVRMAV